MARRYHYKRRKQESFDTDILHVLNLTPMMDILTVLVVFLLVTAVFMSITIMELSIPTSGAAPAGARRNIAIEVIVRKAGLQIANGSTVQATIPIKDGAYDIELLSKMLVRLKEQFPEKQDATVLLDLAVTRTNTLNPYVIMPVPEQIEKQAPKQSSWASNPRR